MRRFGGWIGQVLAWLVILGVVLVLASAVVVPRVSGGTPYTVLTGSMRPSYPPGTLVVVKPVDPKEIEVGDVITYQRESGKATVVTHRVVSVAVGLDGELEFTTQGDDNDVVDRDPVEPVQVRGRLWYSVPYLGHVNTALTGRQRQVAVYGVATVLIGYAAFMFVGAFRGRRSSKNQAEETGTTEEGEDARDHHTVARSSGGGRGLVLASLVGLALLAYAGRRLNLRRTRTS